jgi:HPP family
MRASGSRILDRIWSPLLPGADLSDRLFACFGALCGIALTGWLSAWLVGGSTALLLVAPMGASAVLVFAVPASPLAQPWPVIGGNVLSALVGIGIARVVPVPGLAAGLAVGGAILVMSLTRSLHPPGGASALLAVIGGPAISAMGNRVRRRADCAQRRAARARRRRVPSAVAAQLSASGARRAAARAVHRRGYRPCPGRSRRQPRRQPRRSRGAARPGRVPRRRAHPRDTVTAAYPLRA